MDSKNIVNSQLGLRASDVLLPNLDEALTLTETTNLDNAVEKLEQKNLLTALKCGDKGSLFITERGILKVPSVKRKCIDTTGASIAREFCWANNLN